MSADDRALLAALVDSSFSPTGYRTNLRPAFNAVAGVANDVEDVASDINAVYAQVLATYALNLALGISAYGVGLEQADLPRVSELGTAAFADTDMLLARTPNLQNAAYQFVRHDRQRLTYCTSGTNTWTLPLAADLPDGWCAPFRNRSGNNLTVAREATLADTINGAASSLTVATGATTGWIFRISSTGFEVG